MPAVYPRVCGGTDGILDWLLDNEGLSPRVRGNLTGLPSSMRMPRSIPACAGEPRIAARRRDCREVYPRVCGGTQFFLRVPYREQGLSPRVRGNLEFPTVECVEERSIPACAGEPS